MLNLTEQNQSVEVIHKKKSANSKLELFDQKVNSMEMQEDEYYAEEQSRASEEDSK